MADLKGSFAGATAGRGLLLSFLLVSLLVWSIGATAASRPAQAKRGASELLAQAQILLANGRYQEAFNLLEPYEARLAGNLTYNYLYGIAALDSGHASEAIFALERTLARQPDYSAARMELARAYFEIGDLESARAEFEILLQDNPPELARTAIINYLTAINRRASRYRPHFAYFIQGGLGYDSNANGATDADSFLNFQLDERNVAQSSAYYEVSYGASYSHPVANNLRTLLYAGMRHRRQPSADFVNLDRLHGGLGLVYEELDWLLSGTLLYSRSELDGDFPFSGDYNNSETGVEFGTRIQVAAPYLFLIGNLRIARIEYQDDISVQDVDQYLLSTGYEWVEGENMFRRIGVVAIFGSDEARKNSSPYGRDRLGVRVFGSRKMASRLWFMAEGGFVSSGYDGKFFTEERDDDLFRVATALDWRPFADPRLSLQPHISYLKNRSSIELFEYDRTELGVTLRWASE